ncbi:MAG TPA: DUF6252 family protein, partial [Puia sp.]|nr:DUF6252 family protein [Puia sp.]
MKTRFSSALWITIFYLSLHACQKELSYETSSGGGITDTVPGDFRAKIDGTNWQATTTTEGASIIAGVINVTGISTDNKMITMTVVGESVGTYPLGGNNLSFGAYNELSNGTITNSYSTNQSADTSQGGGSITITQIDSINKTISGTFYFTGYDQTDSLKKVITEGVFNKIPYTASLPPASSTDTFKVVIDGTPWTAPSIVKQTVAGQLYIAGSELNASKTVGLYM